MVIFIKISLDNIFFVIFSHVLMKILWISVFILVLHALVEMFKLNQTLLVCTDTEHQNQSSELFHSTSY